MSFTDVFKKIFGTKADRDMKAIRPMLDKVLEAYKMIDTLSDDELRERCQALKDKIQAAIAADEARINLPTSHIFTIFVGCLRCAVQTAYKC